MKAIVFDMDGVLFDTERLCMNTWHEMARERNLEHMDQVAENSIGRNRVAIEKIYHDVYGEDFPVAQFLDESRRRMWDSIEQNGLKLMKGVMELLIYLRQSDYRIAIASSSGEPVIERYLEIAGMISPPFRPLTPEEDAEMVERINAAQPDFVWVGLGAPKQELWMAAHQGKLRGLLVGVGAAFDYEAENIARAPQWMQKCSLEWLYRLMQDPKRLFHRYLHTNSVYILQAVLRGK